MPLGLIFCPRQPTDSGSSVPIRGELWFVVTLIIIVIIAILMIVVVVVVVVIVIVAGC
jgi:hypothetical protein